MNVSDSLPPRFRVSTDEFSPSQRVEGFREIYGREMLEVELTPFERGGTLDLHMNFLVLPTVRIAGGDVSPLKCIHLEQMADNDDFIFVTIEQGSGAWHQRGRTAEIKGGQALLTTTGDAGTFATPEQTRMTNFRFNRKKIAERVCEAEDALLRPVHESNEALVLLNSYAGILNDERVLASPDLCLAVDDHIHDLVALILGPTREAGDLATTRGMRAARFRAIKDDILANLSLRELSVNFLAGRHRVSERHIRGLFEDAGTTLTDFVLSQRLARVHRIIRDPRYAARSISTIAFACGFGDLSYFNQTFRRQYGATPSHIRAEAWGGHKIS